MTRRLFTFGAAGMLLALGVLLMGCHTDEAKAENTAHTFFKATQMGDQDSLKSTLTEKAQQKLAANTLTLQQGGFGEYTIDKATINGDNAAVPARVKKDGKDMQVTVLMRREQDTWRIWGMAVPLEAPGATATLDFENPEAMVGELMKGAFQGMGAMFKGMGEGAGAMFRGMGEGLKKAAEGLQPGTSTRAAAH